jgi:6,7-dimethyl-8-ribityllumazine synthase
MALKGTPSMLKNTSPLTTSPSEEPHLDGSNLQIGIIVARYNWNITGAMLQLAQDELLRLNVLHEKITTVIVPGAYELPIAAQTLLRRTHFDALICFGCVMKGETRHDVVISDAVAQSLQQVALNTHIPIIFGVMCAENQPQAEARISRGTECARSAIEMACTIQALATPIDTTY